jgi:hypothetical protein
MTFSIATCLPANTRVRIVYFAETLKLSLYACHRDA